MKRWIYIWGVFVVSCETSDSKDYLPTSDYGLSELMQAQALMPEHIDSAYVAAIHLYQKLPKQSSGFDATRMRVQKLIGEIHLSKGRFERSIRELVEALEMSKKLKLINERAQIHQLIGQAFQYQESHEAALDHYKESLSIYRELNDVAGISRSLGLIGHVHEKTNDYDSALFYQKAALDLSDQTKDAKGMAMIYDNMGSIYEDLGDYSRALNHFQAAYLINSRNHSEVDALINLNNVGDIHRKEGRAKEALKVTHDVVRRSKSIDHVYQLRSAYRDLGKTHLLSREYDLAYAYLDSAYELTDEIYSQQLAMEMADLRTLYDVDQKEQRIALLEANQELDQISRMGLLIGIGFLVLAGSIIGLQFRSRLKKSRELYQKEKALSRANDERLRAELETRRLNEEKVHQELESRSRELTTNALHIIQKNEFLSSLKKQLKELKKSADENTSKHVKKLVKSIDYNFSLDDDWQEFEVIFQQVHKDFFNSLRKKYPDLTHSETRLCAMLRMNLHSQDIATIMGISEDSLRISRYRLRKKLAIDKGSNIYAFINSIG